MKRLTNTFKINKLLITSLLLGIFCATAVAEPSPTTPTKEASTLRQNENAKLDAKSNESIQRFIQKMVKKHNFNEQYLVNLFNQVTLNSTITDKMDRPFEAKPWDVYRNMFITDKRIQGGVEYWQNHDETLKRATDKFGVPQSIIIAILGVETNYGEHQGDFPVIEALATLAFNYPARAPFFSSELEHYLLLTRDQKLDPLKLSGSYAGAIGMAQFMPSSYRSYAIDFSGKNQIDLCNNHDDAIGSIANFLFQHGWLRDGRVASKVQLSSERYKQLLPHPLTPKYTVKDLENFGVTASDCPKKEATCIFVELPNTDKQLNEYWIGYHNFYVISRYNRSQQYVMAVHQLAQEIEKAHDTLVAQQQQQPKLQR